MYKEKLPTSTPYAKEIGNVDPPPKSYTAATVLSICDKNAYPFAGVDRSGEDGERSTCQEREGLDSDIPLRLCTALGNVTVRFSRCSLRVYMMSLRIYFTSQVMMQTFWELHGPAWQFDYLFLTLLAPRWSLLQAIGTAIDKSRLLLLL